MKSAGRGGHNEQSTGANALINEVKEDRLVCGAMLKYLKVAGDTTIDCTAGRCIQNVDLRYGTDTANKAKADIFVPIHFNAAYKSYKGAIGTEVFVNPKNASAVATGTRIVNALVALGFKNRGVKDGYYTKHLHDIRQANMDAILVEVCFVEATEDVALYKKLGADKIGQTIAEAIHGHKIVPTVTQAVKKLVVIPVPDTRINNSIALLQAELNKQGAKLLVDGFYGAKTLAACPVLKVGAKGNIAKWLQKRLALKLQDGDFGTGTKAAVVKYQKAVHLTADGIVGQSTWHSLLK